MLQACRKFLLPRINLVLKMKIMYSGRRNFAMFHPIRRPRAYEVDKSHRPTEGMCGDNLLENNPSVPPLHWAVTRVWPFLSFRRLAGCMSLLLPNYHHVPTLLLRFVLHFPPINPLSSVLPAFLLPFFWAAGRIAPQSRTADPIAQM